MTHYVFPLKEPLLSDNLGMELRDYFAAKALVAFVKGSQTYEKTAEYCYLVADEMMKARKQNTVENTEGGSDVNPV